MNEHRFTNALIRETSPYLLQHAHNPVEWQSWNEETLSRAKRENKPILLSIGYSACHWCHVMEKESFEDEKIAALMNMHFINIKVDREERPDIDQIYQNAVQFFIKRGGGWPLTMFLTPEQIPFYGGTYFPPEDRYNIPGFPRVLKAVSKAYSENPGEVSKNSAQIVAGLTRMRKVSPASGLPSSELFEKSVAALVQFFDPSHGGFGGAPKFPGTMVQELFLRHYNNSGDETARDRILHTLFKMGSGGIYDQLGGGFHRYSVDEKWLVPHFEKMLYDNALLIPLYLHGYQLSGSPFLKRIGVETMDYILREMTSPEGGFYSTQDADSEGSEGKFFTWNADEVHSLFSSEEGKIFCRYFDITVQGNFEHKNILNIPRETALVAHELGQPVETVEKIIREGKIRLFNKRETRIKPFRDEKILTGWNGLMISALIKGYRVTGDKKYLAAGEKAIEFIFSYLYREGLLLATFKDGRGRLNGYLDDYAFLTKALLDLYDISSNPDILSKSVALTDRLLADFWDKEEGGFYFTGIHHEPLIDRPKSGHDHSIPSGNSISAKNLNRLYHLTDKSIYLDFAEALFKLYAGQMEENPFGFGSFLSAYDEYQHSSHIVLLARKKENLAPWIARLDQIYLPNTHIIKTDATEADKPGSLKILHGKKMVNDTVTAYLCKDFTCSQPVTRWEELETLLKATREKRHGA
jgi:uncharacterized protein YyaL (SSP411 family)